MSNATCIGGIPRSVVDDAIEAVRDAEWQKRLGVLRFLDTTALGAAISAVVFWEQNGHAAWAHNLEERLLDLELEAM